jgi:hypothetical protein
MASTVACEVDGCGVIVLCALVVLTTLNVLEASWAVIYLHDSARLLLHYLICHTCKYPSANDTSVLGLLECDLLVLIRR